MNAEAQALDLAEQIADGALEPPSVLPDDPLHGKLLELAGLFELFGDSRSIAQEEWELAPGETWGSLTCKELLGSGQFGRVYRAFDQVLQRDVALKIPRHGATLPIDEAEFIGEARRLASVRHPNVVAVHGAAVHEQRAGMWFELLDGETLEQRLNRRGAAQLPEVLRVARALAMALEAVHAAGLVHGDVKASNVMVEPSGRVVLMDFGAGQWRTDEGPARFGSPRVMAPELFEGSQHTPASDSYALGALLFRLLSGEYPIEGNGLEGLRRAHEQGAVADTSKLDAPRALRRLVGALLARTPQERPLPEHCLREIEALRTAPLRRWRRVGVGALAVTAAGALVSLGLVLRAQRATDLSLEREQAVSQVFEDLLSSPQGDLDGGNFTVVELLDRNIPELQQALLSQPLARGRMLGTLGITYNILGQDDRAAELLEEAFALLSERPGEERRRFWVGSSLVLARARGEPEQAIELGRELVAEMEEALEPHDELHVRLRHSLLFALAMARKTTEMRRLMREVDARLDQISWEGPGAAIGYQLLKAQAQVSWGELDEALESLRKAEAELGDDRVSQTALDARSLRARIMIQTGNVAGMDQFLEENLGHADELLGRANPTSLRLGQLMGGLLKTRGRMEEALQLNRSLYETVVAEYGDASPIAWSFANNVALALAGTEQFSEAERVYVDTIERARHEPGGAVWTSLLQANLAEMLYDLGRPRDALPHAREAYERQLTSQGAAHDSTFHPQIVLGIVRTRLGDAQEGHELLTSALEGIETSRGKDSELHIQGSLYLAETLLALGSETEAQRVVQETLPRATQTLSETHLFTRRLRELAPG